jgi:uncharacterized membrane protein
MDDEIVSRSTPPTNRVLLVAQYPCKSLMTGLSNSLTNPLYRHPVHPATVHMPVAFLMASSALDMATHIANHVPYMLHLVAMITTGSHASLVKHMSLLSYVATIGGIVASLPALSSGIAELVAMMQGKGLDVQNAKIRKTLIHAGLNDIAVLGAVYNWYTRRNRIGFASHRINLAISAAILGGVAYSAYLGGTLVYEYGVGVQRMGAGEKIKQEQDKDE